MNGIDFTSGAARIFDLNLEPDVGFGVPRSELEGKLKCEDCGKGNGVKWYDKGWYEGTFDTCTENECKAIGEATGKNCVYEDKFFLAPGGTCTEAVSVKPEPTITPETCLNDNACRKVIGGKIMSIATDVKNKRGIDDIEVADQTGANSFECLILQQAMQENKLQHCKKTQDEGNPLYCDGDPRTVAGSLDGLSYGVMQVSPRSHPNVDVYDFDESVRYAINYLVSLYEESESRAYGCNLKTYFGLTWALRAYNGWNTDCSKGDVNYVENVIGQKSAVAELFPECGYNVPLSAPGEKIWEIAKTFVEERYNTERYIEGNQVDKSFVCARFVTEVLIEAGVEGFSLPPQGYCPLDTVGGLVNALDNRDDFARIDDPTQFEKGDLVAWEWDYTTEYKHMTIFDRYGAINKSFIYVIGEGGRDDPAIYQFYLRGRDGDVFAAYRYVG